MRIVSFPYQKVLIILVLFGTAFHFASAQDRHRVRIKADYLKYMDESSVLNLSATTRINSQTIDLMSLELAVSNRIGDEEIDMGTVRTNLKGEASLRIDLSALKADSLNTYTIRVDFKGSDTLRRATRSISFRDAALTARLISRDSVHSVEAILKDVARDSVLADKNVIVQVERLFAPLLISDEINMTNEYGTVLVPIPADIPGLEGNLKLEAVLADSDDYGTVKAAINAPIGVPIVDESTFNERTLWSPRNKTPLFILLFTGLLILTTWGTIVYLIRILFKIAKQ